jgi:DNA invertase Pin-like site-specific DNA recombinase
LLELCAIFRTLLADQDGIYDPTDYNDRLLLGLKGTMSEAELHILRSRMYQGLLNKAKRGEVFNHAPMGYVKTTKGANGELVIGRIKRGSTRIENRTSGRPGTVRRCSAACWCAAVAAGG